MTAAGGGVAQKWENVSPLSCPLCPASDDPISPPSSEHGATSVDMTKHFFDNRLHDLIYMTSIYVTQLLHAT